VIINQLHKDRGTIFFKIGMKNAIQSSRSLGFALFDFPSKSIEYFDDEFRRKRSDGPDYLNLGSETSTEAQLTGYHIEEKGEKP